MKKASFETLTPIDIPTRPSTETFTLIGPAELFKPLPPAKFIVDGVIRRGSVTIIGGFGASAKTWLAADLVMGIGSGTAWLNHFQVSQGAATYLDWENGRFEISRRLQAISAGRQQPVTPPWPNITCGIMPKLNLESKEFPAAISDLASHRDLIVIDSLRAASPTGDENDSRIRRGLDLLRQTAEETDCAFVVIHHTCKPGSGGGDPRAALRGSGAIFDAADTVLIATRSGDEDELSLKQTKSRFGRTMNPLSFRIQDMGPDAVQVVASPIPTTVPGGTSTVTKSPARDLVHEFIRTHPGCNKREVRDGASVSHTASDKALKKLIADGVIENKVKKNKEAQFYVKNIPGTAQGTNGVPPCP